MNFDQTAVLDCFLSPEEFISHYQANKDYNPDLIISDFAMPKMNGHEMIVKLKSMGFELPPVIFVSGNLDKNRSIAAANIGINRIIEKPFAHNELLEITEELITLHKFKTIHQKMHHVLQKVQEVFSVFRILSQDEFSLTVSNRILLEESGPVRIATTLEEGMNELDMQMGALKDAEHYLRENAERKKQAA